MDDSEFRKIIGLLNEIPGVKEHGNLLVPMDEWPFISFEKDFETDYHLFDKCSDWLRLIRYFNFQLSQK